MSSPASANVNFDRLYKAQKLQQARESLAAYTQSRSRSDLTAADVDFLDRAIVKARQNVERWERWVREWWS